MFINLTSHSAQEANTIGTQQKELVVVNLVSATTLQRNSEEVGNITQTLPEAFVIQQVAHQQHFVSLVHSNQILVQACGSQGDVTILETQTSFLPLSTHEPITCNDQYLHANGPDLLPKVVEASNRPTRSRKPSRTKLSKPSQSPSLQNLDNDNTKHRMDQPISTMDFVMGEIQESSTPILGGKILIESNSEINAKSKLGPIAAIKNNSAKRIRCEI